MREGGEMVALGPPVGCAQNIHSHERLNINSWFHATVSRGIPSCLIL